MYAYLKTTSPQTPELGGSGFPTAQTNSANNTLADFQYPDQLHDHWHGLLDYYMMTGDEWVKEAITPRKAYYLNNETYQGASYATTTPDTVPTITAPGQLRNGMGYTRGDNGIELINASAFSEYLSAIGDPDAAGVLFQGQIEYQSYVDIQGCLSGYPAGCTTPSLSIPANSDPNALSFERGVHHSARGGAGWCSEVTNGQQSGLNGNYRVAASYQNSILAEGVLYFRRAKGPAWTGYSRALDMTYGLSQWALQENFNDDGTANWKTTSTGSLYNGYRYSAVLDIPAVCPSNTVFNTSGLAQITDSHERKYI